MNKKIRRHSGRKTISMGDHEETFWNDWNDYRDSYRYSRDKTLIKNKYVWFNKHEEVERYNTKNKKLLKRRVTKK